MSEALKDLNYDVDIADDNLVIKDSIEQTIRDTRMELGALEGQIWSPANVQELEQKLKDNMTLEHVDKVLANSLKYMKEQDPETTMSTMVENLWLWFVLCAQIKLKTLWFYNWPLDGVYRTHEQAKNKELSPFMKGVEAFQTKRNTDHPDYQIAVKGHANAETLARLMTMKSETAKSWTSRETMSSAPNEESWASESTGDAGAIDIKDADDGAILFTPPGSTEAVTLKASKEAPELYVQEEYWTDGVTTRYEVKMKNGTTEATKAPSDVESASKVTHSKVTFPDFDGDWGADGQGVIIQTQNLLDVNAKPEYMLQETINMTDVEGENTNTGTVNTTITPGQEHFINDTQGITFSKKSDWNGLYVSGYSVIDQKARSLSPESIEVDWQTIEASASGEMLTVKKVTTLLNEQWAVTGRSVEIYANDEENLLQHTQHELYDDSGAVVEKYKTVPATSDVAPSYTEVTMRDGKNLDMPDYIVQNGEVEQSIDTLPWHIATIEDQTYYVTRWAEAPVFTKLDINREVIPYTLTNWPSFKLDDMKFNEFPQTPKNLIDYSNAAMNVQFFGTPGMTPQEMVDPATQWPWQAMMGLENSMPVNTYVAGQVVNNKSWESSPLLRDKENENVMYILRTNSDGTRSQDKYDMRTNWKTGKEQVGIFVYAGNPEAMAWTTTNIVNAPKKWEKDDLKELGMPDNSAYATQYDTVAKEAKVKIQYGTAPDAKNIVGKNIKEWWTAVSWMDPKTMLESSAYFKFWVDEAWKFALTRFSKERPSVNTIQQLEIEKPVV